MTIILDINGDKKISFALVAAFVILTLQFALLVIFNLLDTELGAIIQSLFKLIIAAIYLYSFKAVWNRNSKIFMITFIFTFTIILLQYLFYPQNISGINSILMYMLLINIPTFIYLISIKDISIFMRATRLASYIIFTIVFTLGILVLTGFVELDTYSMSLSYYALFPALISLGDLLKSVRLKQAIIFIVSLLIIIILGSRGPLLCIATFFLLNFFKKEKAMTVKEILTKTFIVLGTILIAINLKNIFGFLYEYFLTRGIYSRTLFMFQEDNYSVSGRDHILNSIIGEIITKPITGIGVAGDRILTGTYSHNIFVEIISGYGVILGGVVSILLVVLVVRALIISNFQWYGILTFWLSVGFIHLMISGSYLIEMRFWIFLAIVVRVNFILTKTNYKGLAK